MKRDELRSLLREAPYDAMVLTSEISRRYATGFHSTAGAVYLSAKQAVFYTDFRYVEAARAAITDFEVREIGGGKSYTAVVNELIEQDGAKKGSSQRSASRSRRSRKCSTTSSRARPKRRLRRA